ncbi:hypothetical protein LCGC14_0015750 [marine sediment metagenome]|uniref:Uncharacterized protein n=1 Tax=marine sediment metagenome TaxID=412755 RepID=A0A0F9Z1X8_9ZZZZ|nr:hypothetical protein [Phycisphaerae bacterium]HDZ43562.1 hypothetical protein [Phycisphaerae bacterium]
MRRCRRHAHPQGQFATMRARWQRFLTIAVAMLTVWLVPASGQTQPPGESAAPTTTAPAKPVSVLHFPADTDQVVVPLVESNHILLTRDVKVNGQTLGGWWFIDTGAAFSALDETAARKLMLAIAPDPLPHLNETVKAEFYRIDSISLGPIRLSNHAILSLNVRSFGKQLNMNIVGIIGADFWGAMPFRIDGHGKELVLFSREHFQPPDDTPAHDISLDRDTSPPPEEAIYFRANPFAGQAIASGRIDDVPCRMMIDTGLSMGIFLLPSFVKDHPDFVDHSGPGHWPLTGFPGNSNTRRAVIDKLHVFGRTVPQPRQAIATLEATDVFDALDYDGVIGGPILRDFRLTFDYARKTVWATWAPPPTMSEQLANGLDPNERNIAGLTPLHRAAIEGDIEAFNALLDAGARTREDAPKGECLLHLAAMGGNADIVAKILEKWPKDVYARTRDKTTPLMLAAKYASAEIVRLLIAADALVNAQHAGGGTPLHNAAFNHNRAATAALIEAGADVNVSSHDGVTPLMVSAGVGDQEIFQLLRSHKATFGNIPGGLTLLHLAAQGGDVELMKHIHQTYDIDIDARSTTGVTPLLTAAWTGKTDAATWLIEMGADPSAIAPAGQTALHFAAERGHTELMQALIPLGVDLNARAEGNETPLLRSALNGHDKIVSALLEAGADPTLANAGGATALHTAAIGGHTHALKALLASEVDVDALCEPAGKTPLMLAAEGGHERAVMLLLKAGADATIRTEQGATTIWWAVYGKNVWVLRRLLNLNGDPNAPIDIRQATPLMFAADTGQVEMVRVLLEAGADPTIKDARGRTAAQHAKGPNAPNIRKMLEADSTE